MIYIIISLSILVVVLGFTTFNLLRKQEKAEAIMVGYLNYLDQLSRIIDISDVKLKERDQNGAFASDDETGVVFNSIKQIQEILNEFNLKK